MTVGLQYCGLPLGRAQLVIQHVTYRQDQQPLTGTQLWYPIYRYDYYNYSTTILPSWQHETKFVFLLVVDPNYWIRTHFLYWLWLYTCSAGTRPLIRLIAINRPVLWLSYPVNWLRRFPCPSLLTNPKQ